eukprot:Opistho-2@81342
MALQHAIISPECDTELFVNFNVFNAACTKLAIAKGLGLAIIAGSAIVKVPQIVKIVSAKSVHGLSLASFLIELFGYSIAVAYNYTHKFPFETWGELSFLAVQNVALVVLFLSFTHKAGLIPVFLGAYGGAVYALSTGMVPAETLKTLQALTIPLFFLSKLPQIVTNFKNVHTGQLSAITTFMNFAGTASRIFTTLTQVDDKLMLLSHLLSTILNGIITLQMIFYWKKTHHAAKDARTKKTK